MSDKFFVVSGTYTEYSEFIKKKATELYDSGMVDGNLSITLSHFVFARMDNLIGVTNPKGFFVGTWYMRDDIYDIIDQLLLSSYGYGAEKYDTLVQIKAIVQSKRSGS